jgi:hypothetical protein
MDWDRFANRAVNSGAAHRGGCLRGGGLPAICHGVAADGDRLENALGGDDPRASRRSAAMDSTAADSVATRCGELDRNQRSAVRARNVRNSH